MAKNLTSRLKKILKTKRHNEMRLNTTTLKNGNPDVGCHFFCQSHLVFCLSLHSLYYLWFHYAFYLPQSAHCNAPSQYHYAYICAVRWWCYWLFAGYGHVRGATSCSHAVECSQQRTARPPQAARHCDVYRLAGSG